MTSVAPPVWQNVNMHREVPLCHNLPDEELAAAKKKAWQSIDPRCMRKNDFHESCQQVSRGATSFLLNGAHLGGYSATMPTQIHAMHTCDKTVRKRRHRTTDCPKDWKRKTNSEDNDAKKKIKCQQNCVCAISMRTVLMRFARLS